MIDNFEVQPYPLWAAVVIPEDFNAFVSRVIGWSLAPDDDNENKDVFVPVLEAGVRAIAVRKDLRVEYFGSPREAQDALPGLKKTERKAAQKKARKEAEAHRTETANSPVAITTAPQTKPVSA